MWNLDDKLCILLEEDKTELIDFDEILPRYNKKAVHVLNGELIGLQVAWVLSHQREEFGFRLHVPNTDSLQQYS